MKCKTIGIAAHTEFSCIGSLVEKMKQTDREKLKNFRPSSIIAYGLRKQYIKGTNSFVFVYLS